RHGNFLGMIGTVVDIHKRKTAEEELLRSRDFAQAASQAKTRFIANVSHEIRTPLGVVSGYADLIEGNLNRDSEERAWISAVRRNVQHLTSLVDDLLDVSRIESGKFSIEPSYF